MSEERPAEGEGIFREMRLLQNRMGLMAFGLDYLLENSAPSNIINKYIKAEHEQLTQSVAKITGGSVEDIADKDKRTPEQTRIMQELSGKSQVLRMEKYLSSDYIHAEETLIARYKNRMAQMLLTRYKGSKPQTLDYFTKRMEECTDKELAALHNITLYFFTTHKDINPWESGNFGDGERAEISALLDKAFKVLEGKRGNPRSSITEAVGEAIGVRIGAKKAAAKASGAIIESYERALSITDKDYQYALSPHPNDTAYIAPFDDAFMKQLAFKDGKISFLDSTASEAEVKRAASGRKMELVKELDIQLLRNLFTAIYHNAQSISGGNVTVYMPAFCKAMGVDMSTGKPNDILGKVAQFRNCVGYTKSGSFYTLLNFSKYDKENNTITFDSPYMNMIIQQIDEGSVQRLPNGKTYQRPTYSYLVHSDIANERNKAAVEIVHEIIALLHQRGTASDKQIAESRKSPKARGTRKKAATGGAPAPADPTITAHKKYSAIVDAIPILQERIHSGTPNAGNVQLARAFGRAFELLREKTDAYEYFTALHIPQTIPTVTTLGKALKITHKGINPNYIAKK